MEQKRSTPITARSVRTNRCQTLHTAAGQYQHLTEQKPSNALGKNVAWTDAPNTWALLEAMGFRALSNVTSVEADTGHLLSLLHPWVLDHFPSCRIGYAKPHPAAFQRVADECDTNPTHMVHIGDDWTCDVVGARSAGVTAIWVSHGRPAPQPELLTDVGLLVAADLAAASKHVADLATWRRS